MFNIYVEKTIIAVICRWEYSTTSILRNFVVFVSEIIAKVMAYVKLRFRAETKKG